jgi:dihydropteroate synthase
MTTLVMGILNLTPDSFADGGRYFTPELAINRSEEMISEGVDIIDIGAESTKPGSDRISEDEELNRLLPVLTELSKKDLSKLDVTISVDTTRSKVAQAAINLGARYINDVSGGAADSEMYRVIADNPHMQYIMMHWRAHSKNMDQFTEYKDLVRDVKEELEMRIEAAIRVGVQPEQIIIDPGIGFSKLPEQNWQILRSIDRFMILGYPVLVGASRKRFLGELTGESQPDNREAASLAITSAMARQGVWAVRTHSVKPHKDVIAVVNALRKVEANEKTSG